MHAGISRNRSSLRGNNDGNRVSGPRFFLLDKLTSVSEITKRQHFCCRSHIGNIGLKFFECHFWSVLLPPLTLFLAQSPHSPPQVFR